ncbi:hypothetical protein AYO20_09962 [Fonsecaea nubica]|uniref:Cysteine-rich transmembrane domain-containing protein n=1 Tax=Fonsecaea nubica TaxID=856822 RepID=A0A178CA26_9EURO|nr:hypothetical protein AYO20_09962 [Fonsecaea nubica]OAL26820.1 hypothetical protein AYO20_09962 [Fonsecaea nubica]
MPDNAKFEPPTGPPPNSAPTVPPRVHHDAGPYYPPDAPVDNTRGPVPQSYPPAQDPNGGYVPPQGWNQGPPGPGPWPPQGPPGQQPPYGYYGPPQPGMYYQPGPPPVGYYDRSPDQAAADGCCAAFLAALTCCCCLDILF